jgi:phosphoglucomutase
MTFDLTTQQNIDQWLSGPYDADTKSIIQGLIEQEDQLTLTDSFYK